MARTEREEGKLHPGFDWVTPGDDAAQTERYSCPIDHCLRLLCPTV